VVIDRDPSCAVAALVNSRLRLDVSSWDEWLGVNLSRTALGDHLVPYHWAPHVLLDWLVTDLERHGLSLTRAFARAEPPARPPVLRETKAGDLALSYAEWLCPPACIEPALCPHTRGPRSWSLATDLAKARHSYVFPCMHLAYGVGTIPISAIFGVRDHLVEALLRGDITPETPVWIGSASHCHGLAAPIRFSRVDRSTSD